MTGTEQPVQQTPSVLDGVPQDDIDRLRKAHSYLLGVPEDHPRISDEMILQSWQELKRGIERKPSLRLRSPLLVRTWRAVYQKIRKIV